MNDHELYTRLGRLEAKVDILLERTAADNKRLGKLERFEARVVAISAVVSLAVGTLARFF